MISRKLQPFGTTVFSEMTRLALEHDAINLSQGFPDFDGPIEIVEAAVEALRSRHNQYARSMGVPALVDAISGERLRLYGLRYDPMTEVGVFSGATEAIASSMLGLLNPGDEVVLFEPFYDSYPACVAMAGAVPRFVTLEFPTFALDIAALEAAITEKTRLIVLNTPHNPTGKVFSRDELETIARLCAKHDLLVLADEVYEHLTFDDAVHVPIAALDGMRERTLSISSAGKTYSFTGWKIGWATGPRAMIQAAQAAHQFVTFATATPLQIAVAKAISNGDEDYFDQLRAAYTARRDLLAGVLQDCGFDVAIPKGAYFILADFHALHDGDDVSFARRLVSEYGVAAIPPSAFYAKNREAAKSLVRFAFCKKLDTLERAAERLRRLGSTR